MSDSKKKRFAVCPGSYDPITNGHVDIIRRAADIFEKVYVAIMINSSKTPLFSTEERLALCKKTFEGESDIEVIVCNGLLTDLARELDAAIVKGIRNSTDFEYEYTMAQINSTVGDVETVFLPARKELTYLSSTVVREFGKYGSDISKFVPESILSDVEDKFGKTIV